MAWTAIAIEGGLFPPDILDTLAAGAGPGQKAADFQIDGRLGDEVQSAFSDVRAYWDTFQRRREHSKESDTTLTREAWMIPFLERLGYQLAFQRQAAVVDGASFTISHRAGGDPEAPPVHIVASGEELGVRATARRSPHALLQEYLNRSDALWGIVTNGRQLRLLRDTNRIAKPIYLEFDLEGIIDGGLYDEFAVLYRLLHRTRLPESAADAPSCILERLFQEGVETGGRVRERLRDGVEAALETLGSAFIRNSRDEELGERLSSGALTAEDYYRELLRLVYRLLFLFVAEERKLVAPPEADPGRFDAYLRFYSVSALRDRCERPLRADRHADLWQGLTQTFRLFREDEAARLAGVSALNGELFGETACRHLEAASCDNRSLLTALRDLSTFEDDGGVRRRVNFAALDVEELGSVYESLLDFHPRIDLDQRTKPFQLVPGSERKQTGSYYTAPGLVQELIESALAPVMEERVKVATTGSPGEAGGSSPAAGSARERAILDMTVCDPAAGSGHFLLAAARRMGRELARIRTGEQEPAPEDYRAAVRDVIRCCIYAVDLNPLAVDLCKVALWIESHDPGKPLTFLDHHIRHGNSLVGVHDLDVLQEGIPDDAYKPVSGDDKGAAANARKINKARRDKQQLALSFEEPGAHAGDPAALGPAFRKLSADGDDSVADIRRKEALFASLRDPETVWWTWRKACDLWTAAFFTPLVRPEAGEPLIPTTEDVWTALDQPKSLHAQRMGHAEALAQGNAFFHWPLEFPDVYHRGGFDVILANPPWEQVQPEEQKFFATRHPDIAKAAGATRKRMIEELPETNPNLAAEWCAHVRSTEQLSKFVRASRRFRLTSSGKVNTYSVFAELAATGIRAMGRAGIIVPTGIATDDSNKHFFGWLVDDGRIAAIYDFENRDGVFPSVHRSYKFSLLTIAGMRGRSEPFSAAFFLTQPQQLREEGRVFALSAGEIALLNPNTKTCPIFRTARDAEITKAIYRAAPVLVREGPPEVNPWDVTLRQGLFNMTSDSHLFRTREQLERYGYRLGDDGRFRGDGETWLPLYEAKLIHQYDHRFATFEGGPRDDRARDTTLAEHQDPGYVVTPRYWVDEREVERAVDCSVNVHPGWFLGFRDIARATDERTAIFSIVPWSGVGHTLPLLHTSSEAKQRAGLLANWNSLVCDFVTRQKLGGTHLTFFIVKQLPVLLPETYTDELLEVIVPRVLELVYTAHDMTPFARDLGYDGPPFVWDEERRAQLRAELDGLYAHLYGLSRDDFSYILDTFDVLIKNEKREFGDYRTKRLCLEAWDYFAPESLRALELEIREMERTFRQMICTALGNDPQNLPGDLRLRLAGHWAGLHPERARSGDPSLRDLLDSSFMSDLDRIVRSDPVWAVIGDRFGSKSKFSDQFGRLIGLRNPLAHERGVSPTEREKGEAALAWFREKLAQK